MSTHQFHTDAIRGMRVASRDASHAIGASEKAQRFGEAMRLMEDGRWRQAFAHLAELADAGQPQAARIALLLVRRGTLLFGGTFNASAQQRASWQRASD